MNRCMSCLIPAVGLVAGLLAPTRAAEPVELLLEHHADQQSTVQELRDEVRALRKRVDLLEQNSGCQTPADEAVPAPNVPAERTTASPAEAGAEFKELVREYNRLFDQQRFAEAEVLAKQARELAPESPVSEVMFWKARFARRDGRTEEIRSTTPNGCGKDAAILPPLSFPKTWEELAETRRKRDREPSTEEIRIAERLRQPISLQFEKATLAKVIQHIATEADINVVIDCPRLREEGVTTDTPVSIEVDGVTLRSALNLVLSPLNLGYTIENEVLLVTNRIRQQGQLEVRTYPVADLVTRVEDRAPLLPDLKAVSWHVMMTVEPQGWDQFGGAGTVRTFDETGSLVVRQTRAVHEQIADELHRLRRLADLRKAERTLGATNRQN